MIDKYYQHAAGGYASRDYAFSLAEFGQIKYLPASEGWIQVSAISNSEHSDARGLYPLFACKSWSELPSDLAMLRETGLVSLVLVTDPFAGYTESLLNSCFPDLMRPYKQHYIVDLTQPNSKKFTKHHRYYARKSLEVIRVETCDNPLDWLEDWLSLYQVLVTRHNIKGIQAFSRLAFERQLALPDLVAFRAVHEDKILGIHLWIKGDNVAYSHLTAFHEDAYMLNASYALYSFAIDFFSDQKFLRLDLGSGAGLETDAKNGLSWFKRGWSNTEKTVYLCGRIFDHEIYNTLVRTRFAPPDAYFPAYRFAESE